MSTTNWHLPSTYLTIRIKACAAAPLAFPPLKEFRVESRNEAPCAQGKTGRTGLQIDILGS